MVISYDRRGGRESTVVKSPAPTICAREVRRRMVDQRPYGRGQTASRRESEVHDAMLRMPRGQDARFINGIELFVDGGLTQI